MGWLATFTFDADGYPELKNPTPSAMAVEEPAGYEGDVVTLVHDPRRPASEQPVQACRDGRGVFATRAEALEAARLWVESVGGVPPWSRGPGAVPGETPGSDGG